MAMQTFGALFYDIARGREALEGLRKAGFLSAQISTLANDQEREELPPVLLETPGEFFQEHNATGSDFTENLSDLGIPVEDAEYFEKGLERGGALVTVHAGVRAAEAYAILEYHGADFGVAASLR
jgi:hypothetical protein